MGKLILLTGGVRSGKSRRALELAKAHGECGVLFAATALESDEEMESRIEKHRAERPRSWRTVEVVSGRLADALTSNDGGEVLVLDCLGLYVSRRLLEGASGEQVVIEALEAARAALDAFALNIFVTNEVGSGLVPPNELGRLFVEALGAVNREVAAVADEVSLMVAGIPVRLR
jgi:adenosylcobinamide kinase/adenosylcobinamide-phosphate guanylyltransferase